MGKNLAKNPMMDRVQIALRQQLKKTHDRVKKEVQEKEELLRLAKREREDTGVKLYSAQQQLSRIQMNLESMNEKHDTICRLRREIEQSNEELKKKCDEKKKVLKEVEDESSKNL